MKKFLKKIFCLFTLQTSLAYPNHKAIVKSEFIFNNPPFKSCHASTICETKSGKILCSFFAGSKEGNKDVSIWLSSFEKNRWSQPHKLIKNPKAPHWNPVLFTMPSNEILLFYKAGNSPASWSGFLKRSINEGKSWSKKEIFPSGIYGPVKNKPLLIKNRLLCPSSQESYEAWSCYIEFMDNNCKKWIKSHPIVIAKNSRGIIQPTLFETKSGKIKILTRSFNQGYIFQAISNDGGCSFSDATATSLPNPNSAIDLIKLKDGRILLVYNHSKTKRTPLNIAISNNDGNNWKKTLTLENKKGEYSYPAVIQTKDELVHITYTWKRKNIRHVVIDPNLL